LAKPKILVTRQLFPQAMEILYEKCDIDLFDKEDDPIPRELLLEKIQSAEGLLCLLTDKIDKEILEKGKNLKVVSNCAVGYNNIDVNEATKRGIYVTNTPGILTETTADLAFALMMAVGRRVVEGDKNIREKKWVHAWSLKMFIGGDIYGKTLGIIGLGRIGEAMVKRAKGFDMKIVYYNPTRREDLEKKYSVQYTSLDELLSKSDFVTLHVPLNDKTNHMIGREQLAKMKKTAYLINTSRGPVVDEQALYEALSSKKIAGAALDVYEKEPIDPANPLIKLDNIVMTPHIASASIDTRTAMTVMAAKNLVAVLSGNDPPNPVNPEIKKHQKNQ
jgi:glyoxylate reductase